MSPSSLYIASIFALSAVLYAGNQTDGRKGRNQTPSPCLTRFQKNRSHFKPCKNQTCFLFLSQAPFIQLDPTMKTEEDQRLFQCKSPMKYYPRLEGISFKIHQQLNLDDVLCVWTGPSCTFDKVVEFVANQAADETTKQYRFGITGLLAQLPERVSENIVPTVQLFESEVVVLGPSNEFQGTIRAAFAQVFRAFETTTWIVLSIFVLLLIILALLVSCVFTRPLTPFNVLMNLCGEHKLIFDVSEHLSRDSDIRRSKSLHRAAVIVLGIGFSAFVVIVVLFYEISIVDSIVNQQSPKVGNLALLSDSALSRYSVLKNSAPERTLRRATDPTGSRFKSDSEFPWFRCMVDDECYDKMLDKKDEVKYMVVLEPEGVWNVRERLAYDSIVQYKTRDTLFLFSGGWYLGTSVPLSEQVRINQEILKVKMSAKLRNIIEIDSGLQEKSFGQQKPRISPGILAIPLIFIVGPCLIIVFLLIICGICMRERVIVKVRERPGKEHDIWSNLGRGSPHGFEYET